VRDLRSAVVVTVTTPVTATAKEAPPQSGAAGQCLGMVAGLVGRPSPLRHLDRTSASRALGVPTIAAIVRRRSSRMEIDQGQKDVRPPGEAGQCGQDGHILLGHGDLREQFRLPSNQRAAVRVSIAHQIFSSTRLRPRHQPGSVVAVTKLDGAWSNTRTRPPQFFTSRGRGRSSRPCCPQFLKDGLAILATRRKRVVGAIPCEDVAVLDHQFKRGGYVPVLAIIQSDGGGHGILPLLRTKILPPPSIVHLLEGLWKGVGRVPSPALTSAPMLLRIRLRTLTCL
jgi:hypothetical protein